MVLLFVGRCPLMIVLRQALDLMVRITKGGRSADYAKRNERNQVDRDGLNDLGNDREQRNEKMVRVGMGEAKKCSEFEREQVMWEC